MHIDNQPVEIERWQTTIHDPQSAIRVERERIIPWSPSSVAA